MSVRPRAGKFNIVCKDQARTQKYDFSILDRKYPFWANLVQKIKKELSVKAEIRYLVYFKYAEINGDVHLFRF